jgi:hypothetical protein
MTRPSGTGSVKAFGYDESWQNFKTGGNKFSKDGKQVPLQETAWFQNYVKQNPDDPDAQKWNVINAQTQLGAKALNVQLEQGEQQVAQRLGISYTKGQSATEAVKACSTAKDCNYKADHHGRDPDYSPGYTGRS